METELKAPPAVHVVLDQKLCLGSFQSKVIQASTSVLIVKKVCRVSYVVTPSEKLANMQCDFIKEVSERKFTEEVLITNWEWGATEY